MEQYLSKLNEPQRQAVEYLDGPALVIAGAGSGKTRVLTYKIVHLLQQGYDPRRVLALTFTNKAANEMRERVRSLVGDELASRLWMGTFHSIFARLLRYNAAAIGFNSNFTIYDAADSRSLIKNIIREMGLDDKQYKPSTIAGAISTAKNALILPDAYAADRDLMEYDKKSKRPMTVEIYRNYQARCRVAGAMDFDDLLVYTNILFRDHPDIAKRYGEYFQYILVDEYQDTNFAQNLIVTTLAGDKGNITVVGDDAQSIYSFRGANIANILQLDRSLHQLKTFKLEQNYRSTQAILDAANALIAKNKRQIPKRVFSESSTGRPVEVCETEDAYKEGITVAGAIAAIKAREHDPYSEFAILYRTNAQSRILEEHLRNRNIPYRIYGGLSFFQRKEVKDAVAYFRLAVNPNDDEALRRVINTPARGIGETTMAKLSASAMERGISIWRVIKTIDDVNPGINRGTAGKLNTFTNLIASFIETVDKGADAYTVTRQIISETRLLSSLMTENTPENISKQENLQELLNSAKEFVSRRLEEGNDDTSLSAFLAEVSLATDQDSDDIDAGDNRVTLMTVHAAKGLEFTNVFIVGVEEDLFPSAMSSGSIDEIEEERRLLYVAITRAKKYCRITYARTRMRNGMIAACSPSRFIRDIGPENLRFINGTPRVAGGQSHSTWGSRTGASSSPRGSNPAGPSITRTRSTASLSAPKPPTATIPSRPTTTFTSSGPALGNTNADPRFVTHTIDEVATGMHIVHSTHGNGVIADIDTSMTEPRIVVNFADAGRKILLLKFARFYITDSK
ncbi:MAG: UvrD-helicase domain-containing protein [Muribaculaceae bacterium]|nr:UvrD-helicase domain-containing protein [Muribaculaceae bacterium]